MNSAYRGWTIRTGMGILLPPLVPALLVAMLLMPMLLMTACSSQPEITREREGNRSIVTVGPFNLGALRRLEVIARVVLEDGKFGDDARPRQPPKMVTLRFPGLPFDRVHFQLDDRKRSFHRQLFEQHIVLITAEDFGEIASASFLSGEFDDGWGKFNVSADDQDLLREFAREISVLP